MSPIDKETIEKRLQLLNDVVAKLDKIQTLSVQRFLGDYFVSDTAIRNLVLGIEIIVDIGNHILAEAFHGAAKTYKDVILDLGKAGVITKEFAAANATMTDFRNLLIHAYTEINLKKVHGYLLKAPDVFRGFYQAYLRILEKNS